MSTVVVDSIITVLRTYNLNVWLNIVSRQLKENYAFGIIRRAKRHRILFAHIIEKYVFFFFYNDNTLHIKAIS